MPGSRALGSTMHFCFNPKAKPSVEKIQQFQSFKRCFMFFSTLLVFHNYLELFINQDQWIHLIFDTVNDVSRFKGLNAARPQYLSYDDVTDRKVFCRTL